MRLKRCGYKMRKGFSFHCLLDMGRTKTAWAIQTATGIHKNETTKPLYIVQKIPDECIAIARKEFREC